MGLAADIKKIMYGQNVNHETNLKLSIVFTEQG